MLKERYKRLREFIEPTQPNNDGDMIDEEWHGDNVEWESFSDGVDDDDIEVGVNFKAHW